MPTNRLLRFGPHATSAEECTSWTHSTLSLANILLGDAPSNTVEWVITYTPLRIVWAGPEAVWVFFVLGGFVLARPYLATRRLEAGRYHLRRFLRLYLPVLASFVLAAGLRLVPREPAATQSWWIAGHVPAAGIKDSIRTMSLLFGDNITLDLVWWSLQWEVWFSNLLPVVVVIVHRARRHGAILVATFEIISAVGRIVADNSTGRSVHLMKAPLYLSMFGVGAALVLLEEPIRRRLALLSTTTAAAFIALAITSLTLPATIEALTRPAGVIHAVGLFVSGASGVVGAAACVVAALALPLAVRALEWRPIHWLGTRSFSLYLVHDPIIATIVLGFGLSMATWWSVPLGIVIALIVAAGFYRVVEAPVLSLLRRIPANRSAPGLPAQAR